MAQKIISVVTDPKMAESLAINSRHFVEDNYDYEKIAQNLSNIYESVAVKNKKK
jgi:glycosyltransferase involved in cell wall biosynthesis